MANRRKYIILFAIAIGVVIAVIFIRKAVSKSSHSHDQKETCRKVFETCGSGQSLPCCSNMSCTNGQCRYVETAPKMDAFQLKKGGKCLGFDTETRSISLVDDCDWDKNWWSWDQKNLRIGYIENGTPTIYCLGGSIAPNAAISIENIANCTNNTNIRLIYQNGVASITDSSYRYCAVLRQIPGTSNYNLLWKKCVDMQSGEGEMFEIVTKVPGSDCKKVGEGCDGDGKNSNCCPPFRSCEGGFCSKCVGDVPQCKDHEHSSEHAVCGDDNLWHCASRCDLDKKPTCQEGTVPSCQQDGDNWKWECISECQGQAFPSGCPKYTCQKDKDGKYVYMCSAECVGNHVDVPSPPKDLLNQLSSCKQTDPNDCASNEPNKICYQCKDDYKILYWNCYDHKWEIMTVCGTGNRPECPAKEDPVCVVLDPDECKGKTGLAWMCPSAPKDWCELTSHNKLEQEKACSSTNDSSCDTPIYLQNGVPIWPTVSYNDCSNSGEATLYAGVQLLDNPNPDAFVKTVEENGVKRLYLYPNTEKMTYQGREMRYNPNNLYYKPGESSSTREPPFCMMESPCDHGNYTISKDSQLADYPNFSTVDPRSANNPNSPPTTNELIDIGKCTCTDPYVGYICDQDKRAYCSNHGDGVTDITNSLPSPGVKCKCDDQYAGDRCDKDRSNTCNNHGYPSDDGKCVCDTGWSGDTCDVYQVCDKFREADAFYLKHAAGDMSKFTDEEKTMYMLGENMEDTYMYGMCKPKDRANPWNYACDRCEVKNVKLADGGTIPLGGQLTCYNCGGNKGATNTVDIPPGLEYTAYVDGKNNLSMIKGGDGNPVMWSGRCPTINNANACICTTTSECQIGGHPGGVCKEDPNIGISYCQ